MRNRAGVKVKKMSNVEILEAMADNDIVVNMPPKRRYSINLRVGGRGKPAFRNLETEIDCRLPRLMTSVKSM